MTVKRIVAPLSADEQAPATHAQLVEEWWAKRAQGLSPPRAVALFDLALSALWRRARRTLGEVTLSAIVDRVLATATEIHPLLTGIRLDHGRISSEELRRRAAELSADAMRSAFCMVLIDWLTVVGNLTAEILTPSLHEALSLVALDEEKS